MHQQHSRAAGDFFGNAFRHAVRDTYAGFVAFTHNGLAIVGLTAMCVVVLAAVRPDIGARMQQLVLGRFISLPVIDANPLAGAVSVSAVKAADMLGLNSRERIDARAEEAAAIAAPVSMPVKATVDASAALGNGKEHMAITRYLARKYRVSVDAVDLMVSAAYLTGREVGVDPALLLAVMAVESGFNPFAESVMGAQGLMQVMSKVHSDKLDDYGGARAALNPVANIRIGAMILKDCIKRGGSIADGLRLYVGAGMGEDGGYGSKVLQEKDRIQGAARGQNVAQPMTVSAPVPARPSVQARTEPVHPKLEPVRHLEQQAEKPKDQVAAL